MQGSNTTGIINGQTVEERRAEFGRKRAADGWRRWGWLSFDASTGASYVRSPASDRRVRRSLGLSGRQFRRRRRRERSGQQHSAAKQRRAYRALALRRIIREAITPAFWMPNVAGGMAGYGLAPWPVVARGVDFASREPRTVIIDHDGRPVILDESKRLTAQEFDYIKARALADMPDGPNP